MTITLTQPQYRTLRAAVVHLQAVLEGEGSERAVQELETLERAWTTVNRAWMDAG